MDSVMWDSLVISVMYHSVSCTISMVVLALMMLSVYLLCFGACYLDKGLGNYLDVILDVFSRRHLQLLDIFSSPNVESWCVGPD